MSQYHKTCYYLQKVIRDYINTNKSFNYDVVEGGCFSELNLPFVAVLARSQETMPQGYGTYGNKTTTLSIVLQTGLTTTEKEHWDLWAEIEDLLNKKQEVIATELNDLSDDIRIQMFNVGGLNNDVSENVRITQIDVDVFSYLI